jgi:hypothetical protein
MSPITIGALCFSVLMICIIISFMIRKKSKEHFDAHMCHFKNDGTTKYNVTSITGDGLIQNLIPAKKATFTTAGGGIFTFSNLDYSKVKLPLIGISKTAQTPKCTDTDNKIGSIPIQAGFCNGKYNQATGDCNGDYLYYKATINFSQA